VKNIVALGLVTAVRNADLYSLNGVGLLALASAVPTGVEVFFQQLPGAEVEQVACADDLDCVEQHFGAGKQRPQAQHGRRRQAEQATAIAQRRPHRAALPVGQAVVDGHQGGGTRAGDGDRGNQGEGEKRVRVHVAGS